MGSKYMFSSFGGNEPGLSLTPLTTIVSILGSPMNCILDWQFILLKPINLVKCVFFVLTIQNYIFLMDGHKCLKFYILMHKYIADIVYKYPPSSQLLSKFLIFTQFLFYETLKKTF